MYGMDLKLWFQHTESWREPSLLSTLGKQGTVACRLGVAPPGLKGVKGQVYLQLVEHTSASLPCPALSQWAP